MKITTSTSALATIVCFALAVSAVAIQAQTTDTATSTTATTTAPAKPKATTTEYAGILSAIDPGGTSITVTGTKRTLVLAVTAKTKYHKDTPALSDFAVGDHVTGSYTKDASGALTAYSIHKKVLTTTPKPAATPAAAPTPATPATQ
jgi:hypothetical protein